MTTATLTIEGDAEEVLALAGRLGLKPYLNQPQVIPEPALNHTEPVVSTSLAEPLPPVVQQERPAPPVVVIETPSGPREVSPLLKPAKRSKAPLSEWRIPRQGPDGNPVRDEPPVKPPPPGRQPAVDHDRILAQLTDRWQVTSEIAAPLGYSSRQCGGIGKALGILSTAKRCAARQDPETGRRQYRRLAPVEEIDETPTPLVDLPPRAAHLLIPALMGHALTVVTALWQHGTIGLARLMELTLLDEETCRGVLRTLMREGYVAADREDGRPTVYRLTDQVVPLGGDSGRR